MEYPDFSALKPPLLPVPMLRNSLLHVYVHVDLLNLSNKKQRSMNLTLFSKNLFMFFTLDCNEKYLFFKRDWHSVMRKAEGLKTEVAVKEIMVNKINSQSQSSSKN